MLTSSSRRQSLGQEFDVRTGKDEAAQRLVLMLALHAADVSNPAKPWPVYNKWADRVVAEFYAQGDRERERGWDVTPAFDRTKPIPKPKFQLGFINAIVLPLYEALDKVDGIDFAVALRCLRDNIRRWTALLPPQAPLSAPASASATGAAPVLVQPTQPASLLPPPAALSAQTSNSSQ